nr:hypothetical protein K-LCC10_0146 [Kaumoebavirus]
MSLSARKTRIVSFAFLAIGVISALFGIIYMFGHPVAVHKELVRCEYNKKNISLSIEGCVVMFVTEISDSSCQYERSIYPMDTEIEVSYFDSCYIARKDFGLFILMIMLSLLCLSVFTYLLVSSIRELNKERKQILNKLEELHKETVVDLDSMESGEAH